VENTLRKCIKVALFLRLYRCSCPCWHKSIHRTINSVVSEYTCSWYGIYQLSILLEPDTFSKIFVSISILINIHIFLCWIACTSRKKSALIFVVIALFAASAPLFISESKIKTQQHDKNKKSNLSKRNIVIFGIPIGATLGIVAGLVGVGDEIWLSPHTQGTTRLDLYCRTLLAVTNLLLLA
jgi:hypothetical protein